MKICTYNIWNAGTNFDIRLELLIKEINNKDIDIIALQEVKDEETYNYIKSKSSFQTGFYFDGLAFLSNYNIKQLSTYSKDNNYILRVTYNNTSFTNVHLDWENKENRIKGIDEYFSMLEENIFNNEFLLGDFNDVPEEVIHHELIMSDFIDIHQTYSHSINQLPLPTLDIPNNPRWRNLETKETPYRFDWIMLNTSNKYSIEDVRLIGREETNEITPSDHYGVLALLDISLD